MKIISSLIVLVVITVTSATFVLASPSQVASSAASLDIAQYLKGLPPSFFAGGLEPVAKALSAGRHDEALTLIRKIKDSSERSKRLERILYLEALAHGAEGSIDQARLSVQQSLALKGSNSDVLFLYAQLLSAPEAKLDALTQALWFNRFISIPPFLALSQQAALLLEQGQPTRAETLITKAVAQNPLCVECRMTLAEVAMRAGKKPDAIASLRQAVAIDPARSEAKAALARTLLAGAQRSVDGALIREAKTLAGELYTKDAKTPATATLYAQALIESGELSKAMAVISSARAKQPEDPTLARLAKQIQLEGEASSAQPEVAPVE